MEKGSWTDAQYEAITKEDGNLIVSAGAGSGKTAVLTQRVVYFVAEKGISINDMLIVTFTRAAASEMKNRIRKALRKAGSPEADLVESSDITTFDAFFLSLVKRYKSRLGIDGEIKPVEEYVCWFKKYQILSQILDGLSKNEDERLAKIASYKNDISTREIIDSAIDLYKKLSRTGNPVKASSDMRAWISHEEYAVGAYENYLYAFKHEIREYLKEVIAMPRFSPMKNPDVDFFFESKEAAKACMKAQDYATCRKHFDRIKLNTNNSLSVEDREMVKEIRAPYQEHLEKVKKKYAPADENVEEFIAFDVSYNLFLLDLIDEMHRRIEEWKRDAGLFEFEDIARMALTLIEENGDIREEVKNRYRMVMVDEFQDTSEIQNKFIDLIANDNLYLVGDVKQSIYLFRGARPDLFNNRYKAYKEGNGGSVIDMNKNFRSRKQILEGVNTIFGSLMSTECGGVEYLDNHAMAYGNKAYLDLGSKENGGFGAIVINSPFARSHECLRMEIAAIADDIKRKVESGYMVFGENPETKEKEWRKCKYSDFALIPDRKTDFDTVNEVFMEKKIPCRLEYEENIVENDIVLVLESLFTLLKMLHQGVDLSLVSDKDNGKLLRHTLFSVERSFLYGTDDETLYKLTLGQKKPHELESIKDLMPLAKKLDSLPSGAVFRLLVDAVGLEDKLIRIGNIETGLLYIDTLGSTYESLSRVGYSVDDFLTLLSNIRILDKEIDISVPDPGVDSVVAINSHKSKGLEYPIVYFYGLSKKFRENETSLSKSSISARTGVHFPAPTYHNPISLTDGEYAFLDQRSESLRLLYVALTRVREKGYVVACLDSAKKDAYTPLQRVIAAFLDRSDDLDTTTAEIILRNVGFDIEEILTSYVNVEVEKEKAGKGGGSDKFDKAIAAERRKKAKEALKNPNLKPMKVVPGRLLRETCNAAASYEGAYRFLYGCDYYPWSRIIDNLGKISANPHRIDGFSLAMGCSGLRVKDDCLKRLSALGENATGGSLGFELEKDCVLESDEDFRSLATFSIHKGIEGVLESDADDPVKDAALMLLGVPENKLPKAHGVFGEDIELLSYARPKSYQAYDVERASEWVYEMLYGGPFETREFFVPNGFVGDLFTAIETGKVETRKQDDSGEGSGETDTNPDDGRDNNPEANATPEVHDLHLDLSRREVTRYSHDIDLDVDTDLLEYGTSLHEAMRVFVLQNRTFEGLSAGEIDMAKRFLASPCASEIEKAKARPEYSFVNEGREGSIDLLLIFPDKVRIVDYKTSTIDKDEYRAQVRGYMEFAEAQFNRPAEGFLYSLKTGKWLRVD